MNCTCTHLQKLDINVHVLNQKSLDIYGTTCKCTYK